MSRTVIAVGETLWDMLPGGAVLGGAPFNFAYRVNSLGDKGLIVTRLGRDGLGRKAHDAIVALGMDTRFVQWDAEKPTGTVNVELDEHGNPDFEIVPEVAYDKLEATGELIGAARSADCICYGTLIQRTVGGREAVEAILDASPEPLNLLDINLRKECFTEDTVTSSLERADLLKLNDDEAHHIDAMLGMGSRSLPSFAQLAIERWGLSHCVVTLGDRGAFAADEDEGMVYVPGYAVDVVDTCGSGDAFTAGFIHRLLRSDGLAACCRLGNALGALVAGREGGTAAVSRDELDAFMGSDHERLSEPDLEPYAAD